MTEATVPAVVVDTGAVVPSMLRPGVGLVTIDRWRASDRAHQERLARASLGDDSPVVRFIAAQRGVEVLGFERFEPFGTVTVPD